MLKSPASKYIIVATLFVLALMFLFPPASVQFNYSKTKFPYAYASISTFLTISYASPPEILEEDKERIAAFYVNWSLLLCQICALASLSLTAIAAAEILARRKK